MRLGVNIDHIATIRNARGVNSPDPIEAVVLAELAGADGIVCHLREDRRHINDVDLHKIRATVKSFLNMEMAPTDEMVNIALKIKPDMVTLVPEKREELTTEGGLNVSSIKEYLSDIIYKFNDEKIAVSLFIDPDTSIIRDSISVGADYVELHTGAYANAKNGDQMQMELEKIKLSVSYCAKNGINVSAGHGLNYNNVKYIAQIHEIEELNIGHSIIGRAALVGMEKAIKEMKEIIYRESTLAKQLSLLN